MDTIKNNKRGLKIVNSLSLCFQICSQKYYLVRHSLLRERLWLFKYCKLQHQKSPQLQNVLSKNLYSTTGELVKLLKHSTYKKCSNYENWTTSKNIRHMENIQLVKSIQHVKNIQYQKITEGFQAIIDGNIFHSNAFCEDIYFSSAKNSFVSTMSFELPDYFWAKSMILEQLRYSFVATMRTHFWHHVNDMKTYVPHACHRIGTFVHSYA